MTANQLRRAYIGFFERHGHAEIKSASLVPENDPTVLFTTAGMHPLVPFLLGERHPAGVRLVNCQKCVRTDDIEEVYYWRGLALAAQGMSAEARDAWERALALNPNFAAPAAALADLSS